MKFYRRATGKGFTLIELLVVIAIIAILAAILFPVFARARENGRRAACMSNMKQIGLGLMQYTQDFDEKLPVNYFGPTDDGDSNPVTGDYKWMDAIYPYIKSEQLFSCPSDSDNPAFVYYKNLSGANKKYGSYALNVTYWGETSVHNPEGKSLAAIPDTAGTIFIGEHNDTTTNGPGIGWKFISSGTVNQRQPGVSTYNGKPTLGRMYARHLDTTNVLYCDGHIKSLALSRLNVVSPISGAYAQFTIEAD